MQISRFLSINIKFLDYIIALIFLFASVFFLVSWSILGNGEKIVLITTPKAKYEYPLNTNRKLKIMGDKYEASVEIKNHSVGFVHSPCPSQVCLHFGFIKNTGTSAVCIPNKIVVSIITKNRKTQVDTICK